MVRCESGLRSHSCGPISPLPSSIEGSVHKNSAAWLEDLPQSAGLSRCAPPAALPAHHWSFTWHTISTQDICIKIKAMHSTRYIHQAPRPRTRGSINASRAVWKLFLRKESPYHRSIPASMPREQDLSAGEWLYGLTTNLRRCRAFPKLGFVPLRPGT